MNSEAIIRRVDAWQKNKSVHPLTCGNNSNHKLLFAQVSLVDGEVRLFCPDCDYVQDFIPEIVFDGTSRFYDPERMHSKFANEMRANALETRKHKFEDMMRNIFSEIESSANLGELETIIFLDKKRRKKSEEIVTELRRCGYKVFSHPNKLILKW